MKSEFRTDPRLRPLYWEWGDFTSPVGTRSGCHLVAVAHSESDISQARIICAGSAEPPASPLPFMSRPSPVRKWWSMSVNTARIRREKHSIFRGFGAPRFGAVEQIDDYRFRYSAPLQNLETDTFAYQVVEASGVENEGWVLVDIGARAQSQPATTDARTAETPAKTALPPRMEGKSEEQLQTTPAASKPVAITAPGLAPTPESGAIPESAATAPGVAPMPSKELHARIADVLDAEDLPQVRSFCQEAMATNVPVAKFCRRWWSILK